MGHLQKSSIACHFFKILKNLFLNLFRFLGFFVECIVLTGWIDAPSLYVQQPFFAMKNRALCLENELIIVQGTKDLESRMIPMHMLMILVS